MTHLRDVSWSEWKEFSSQMDKKIASRAAHVIGEDERVVKGKKLLTGQYSLNTADGACRWKFKGFWKAYV